MKALERRRVLAGSLLAAGGMVLTAALPAASVRQQLSFVSSRPEADPRTQWLIGLYGEALGQLGLTLVFVDVPASRAVAMETNGEVDGDLARAYAFGAAHPEMVRVEEPNNTVRFSAFAAGDSPEIAGWQWLENFKGRIATRRGIREIETRLEKLQIQGRADIVTTPEQGLLLLQAGRVTFYLDVADAVFDYLSTNAAYDTLAHGQPIREAGLMETTTGHAYLYRARHEKLAIPLSDILRQLKAAGRSQQLLSEAFARAGYHPAPLFGQRPV
ncbi:hypothetical protein [Radicibacter daui]|uniref:hypothetical protein n=1 Tax=Radicibacter daui TaxID=3064829 RepID=UPI004046BC95